MHAVLKRPIWIGDVEFKKGTFDERNPNTKLLFEKDWFLESLEKSGYLVLHRDVVEETVLPVDSIEPQEEIAADAKPHKKRKEVKADN